MRARHATWLLAVTLLTLTTACATTAPSRPTTTVNLSQSDAIAKQIHTQYYEIIANSVDLYAVANDAVRFAHEGGLITDAQAERVAPYLRAAESALRTARDTIGVYLGSLESGTASGMAALNTTALFNAAQKAVTDLLNIAKEMGVIQ